MKFNKKQVLIIIIMLIGIVFLFSSSVSAADTKVLVTKTSTGGHANAQSTNPSVSADGNYVAYESYATNLGSGSSDKGVQDIYVYSYKTKKTEWITHTPTGKAANGNSYNPSISGDGRYVTFASTATNLGPGGSGNGIKDIYLYDRKLKIMKWITHSPSGGPASNHSANPVISSDGNYIAFQSTAKNLGPGGSEYYVSDIYLYNRITGDLKWITHTVRGFTANGASMNPTINENGRYIAFETVATNLGPLDFLHYGSGYGIRDIFCYDRVTETMEWLTVSPPKVTADIIGGTFNVPFNVTLEMNQLGTIYWSYDNSIWETYSDLNQPYIYQNTHLYFYGVTLGGTLSNLYSENYIFPTVSDQPSVWANPSTGQYYNFVNVNLNMDLPGSIYYSTGGSYSVYTGTLTFIENTVLRFYGISSEDVNSDPVVETYTIVPTPLSVGGINPSISADGNLVAYQSGNSFSNYMEYANNSIINQLYDNIFVYNRLTGENMLLTKTTEDGLSNGTSANPSISGDGNFVAFESTANNLGIDPDQPYGSNMPGVVFYDDSFRRDIFVYDISTSSIFYLNWITHDTIYGPANGNSYTPSLNGDGTRLAFSSSATNLGPGGNGVYRDIFLNGDGLQDTLPNVISISQLNAAAKTVRTYYENHSKTLPASVTIKGNPYSMSQFLDLLVTATVHMNYDILTPVTARSVNPATSPSGTISSGNIMKSSYLAYAKSIKSYINTHGRAPNYIITTLGHMQLKYMVYMYSKIVNYYNYYNRLPNYVSINK